MSSEICLKYVLPMRSGEEIKARQDQFVTSYRFPKTDIFPKMKAWTAAINASVRTRYYPVYSCDRKGRPAAVFFWKAELEKLGEKYKQSRQTRAQFIKDVCTLQASINKSQYHNCFANGRIRIGQCQKSLSIFLKWMWCQGELAGMPPVCPIDGQVLAKCRRILKEYQEGTVEEIKDTYVSWSNLDCLVLYERLVDITEKVAALTEDRRPAVWELFAFEKPVH